ncbi:hypothetical protein EAH68_12735 [Corynebacterium hylobatis]|uniref:Uncharacterized protein n=1 Tax=Corynebacterium hylobatis TaxID=1859290 RepID=A0A430HVB1_9CORY|nr:hypothetical protein [Corynebacterium hylobatis]RSZ61525.1 hypothetical protein EAH68_12735 [Corynebacterium hylobatis]
MTQLKITRTGMNIYAGTDQWWVATPTSPYAPQILTMCGDTATTDTIRTGTGEDLLVGIPVDQLDLFIEALITVRKEAGRAPAAE